MHDTTQPDIAAGQPVRVRITIYATLNGRYVRPVVDPEDPDLAVEESVDRVIRETIISGLAARRLDGTGEDIWSDWSDWEWQVIPLGDADGDL